VAAELKLIYTAATDVEAEQMLAEFSLKWDEKFAMIASSWRRNWICPHSLRPFFAERFIADLSIWQAFKKERGNGNQEQKEQQPES
jgi:transposase-like protein